MSIKKRKIIIELLILFFIIIVGFMLFSYGSPRDIITGVRYSYNQPWRDMGKFLIFFGYPSLLVIRLLLKSIMNNMKRDN